MTCVACAAEARDWFGDAWCDPCGGVMIPTAEAEPHLIFRHVATVDGAEHRLPIVWDASAGHYLFRWPNKVNPRFLDRNPERVDDIDFGPTPILSTFGILDVVLTQALNAARGDASDVPELSMAPSSTPEERSLALLGV